MTRTRTDAAGRSRFGRAGVRLVLALTIAGTTLIAPAAHAQVPPPTLSGEQLVGQPDITAECNPDGTSTVTFSVSGVATGPYPGTFTEVGTATIGPQTVSGGNSTGPLLTFDAAFTIDSPAGDVTGTKTLVLPLTDFGTQVAVGTCTTFGTPELGNHGDAAQIITRFAVRYQAQITTEAGTFADQGVNPQTFVQRVRFLQDPIQIVQLSFLEDFLSDLTTPQPLTSPGQSTGGGQIPGDVTFGFNAKSDKNGVKGTCTVIDLSTNTMIKCLDATSYFQTATQATFSGAATVNGVETTYKIRIDDNAEPGAGADTFTITTGTGYTATGLLTQGNIQVHT